MLHILLLILKIIGIILAVILGILLLLIGIVLFVPIRYEISAKCDGTIDSLRAKGKVTWLLHLLQAEFFVKGTKLKWQVRVAWIKKSNAMVFGERKEESGNDAKKAKKDSSVDTVQKVEKADVKDKKCKEATEITEEKCEDVKEDAAENRLEETTEESSKSDASISDKIKDLLQKKEKITDFLTEESHVCAFKKVKKALFVLLKRLKPKKINMKLHFGFDDPSVTGKVLAGLSIIYPFLGDTTEIIPDFENKILEGKVYLKGRIRLCHFIWMALKLLLSRGVRISYKDIRNFKL